MKPVDFYQQSTDSILDRAETYRSKLLALKKKLAASTEKIRELELKLAQTTQQRDAFFSGVEKLFRSEEFDYDERVDTAVDHVKNFESQVPSDQKVITNGTENISISSNQDQGPNFESQPESATLPSGQHLDTSQKGLDQGHRFDNNGILGVEKEVEPVPVETPISDPKIVVDTNDDVNSQLQPVQNGSSPLHFSKDRSWECSICDRRFTRAEILAKHIIKIHGTAKATLKCIRGFISHTINSILMAKRSKRRRNKNLKLNSSLISMVNKKRLRQRAKNIGSRSINRTHESKKQTDDSNVVEDKNTIKKLKIEQSFKNADSINTSTNNESLRRRKTRIHEFRTKDDSATNEPKKRKLRGKKIRNTKKKNNSPVFVNYDLFANKKSKMTLRRKSQRYDFRKIKCIRY